MLRKIAAYLKDVCISPHNDRGPVKLPGCEGAHSFVQIEVFIAVFFKSPEDRLVSRRPDSTDLFIDPVLILPDHQCGSLAYGSAAAVITA